MNEMPQPAENKYKKFTHDLDEKLQAEIEAALGDMSLEDMLDVADKPKSNSSGELQELKSGTIVSIQDNDIFVEFGPKSMGICPRKQFDNPPTVGERLQFIVERYDAKEGLLLLSREGAVRKAAWESLQVGQVIEARCTGTNKGGLEMDVANHKAFMPAGQVDLRHIEDLAVYVGEKMPCEIIELDKNRGRIILSRKSTMEVEQTRLREKLLEELKEGDQRSAVITSIQQYGAFADIGGIDGLIHISDIAHHRLKNPSEVVKEGQQVTVKIIKIDRESDPPRIGLGMKQCMDDPYESKYSQMQPGDTVSGRVTKIVDFGAFVEIAPGIEGLLHISQLAEKRVNRVSQIVKVDEVITVKVLDIDAKTRRISLSLRAAKAKEAEEQLKPDDAAMRKLKAKFGSEHKLKGGIG
ncbi:MAG: S1 RNA-binding domain-containing protein [Planctomycetes bacterium]|nr:S1 RNA-binding domain-containing protein [Planctomycetota bacterium]